MRGRRCVLPVLALILLQASFAQAQQAPWTGIAADEARPAATGGGFADPEMMPRSMSDDGRFVAFYSSLPTLVAGDTNNSTDVFVRDRHTGELRRVSVASDGSQSNGYSAWSTMSGNGRHIAFNSCATNFDPADTNNSCDLFIHDRELGTTVRANFGPGGEQATITTQHHFNLSADGRYFVFIASFTANYARGVWLRDRDGDANGVFDEPGTAITTLISPTVGQLWETGYDDAAISHDGRWIAYNALTLDDTGNPLGTRLYLHDRVTMTTVRVDRPMAGGADTAAYSGGADFSESGHLAYSTNADSLAEGDTDADDDIYVYDIATGVNTLIEFPQPSPYPTYVGSPAMNADGRFLAFTVAESSYSGFQYYYNVYVVDRQTGLTHTISAWPDGTLDNRAGAASLSADGSAIAFPAGAEMLPYAWGNNGVFVATGVALAPAEITIPGAGGWFTIDVTVPARVAWSVDQIAEGADVWPTSGVGPGTIDVFVYPNEDGEEREYWVRLGSEVAVLRQTPLPFIYWINPWMGSPGGGTSIEITGIGFAPGATVTIGGVSATNVVVVNSNLITAITPANPIGTTGLTVSNPNGDSYDFWFEYIDATPPVVTRVISGTPGANGWYTSDVSVQWSYEDPESTVYVTACVSPYLLKTDGVEVPLCSVYSAGGSTLDYVELKRDTVAPTIAIFPSEPETYFQGQLVPIAHNCADFTSGIETCTATQTGMHLDTSTVGTFDFSVTAVDRAGHSTTTTTTYTVKIKPQIDLPEASAVYGGTAVLRANVTAFGSGAPLAGKAIRFFVAYVPVGTAITSATGEAVLNVPLESRGAGSHPIHVEFAGDDTALSSITHGSLTIEKATPVVTWANPAPITERVPLGSTQLNATASVPGAFAYDPGYWTMLPPGTHTLTVNFAPADSANYNFTSKTVTVKVKAYPVITWPAPAAITYPVSLSAGQLNATANVEGTFVYLPAPGTLLDAGTHTLYVTFNPSNTAEYVSESATTTIEVLKGTVTINWPPYINPFFYGAPLTGLQLNAEASAPGSLTYSPPYGTILNAGTQTLTVTYTSNSPANYHPATATQQLLVRKAYPVVYWQGDLAPIVYGTPLGPAQLYATSPNAGTITYDPPAGTLLDAADTPRTIRMTFTPDDTANYNTVTYQKDIAVVKQTTTVTWGNLAPIVYGTALGAAQLNATASQPGTFSYSPPAGTVLNAGTHTLQVYFTPNSSNYYGGSWTTTLVVEKRTPVITWSNPVPITYGTALGWTQYNATVDVGGGSFEFTPPLGTVLNAGAGLTLTATYLPGSTNYNSTSASVTIDVVKATPYVTWVPVTGITYGTPLGTAQLNAAADRPGTFAYTPGEGTVLPAGTHGVQTTFTPNDSVNYASVVLNRQVTVLRATPVLNWQTPAAIVYGTPLSSTQLNATASTPGTFAYTTVPGAVLSAGTHTMIANFVADDQSNYLPGPSISVTIEVVPATPVITWNAPAPVVYGTALSAAQLNATASVSGTFTYSHPAGSVLTAGAHPITATFTPQSSNYTTATATVEIVVGKAAAALAWTPPAPITYGAALGASQLNATANVAGSFVYSPPAGTVLGAGTHSLSVAFEPNDAANYTAASGTVSVVVGKAAPMVTWAAPSAITYGSPLSASELNAAANIPGSFAYSPAAGSVLGAGTHNLSVTFTPDDSANYDAATGSVSIVVAKAAAVVSWAEPTAITYGTALSTSELNATANLAGTFAYFPAAGTVLAAATHQLTVTFTPDDSANYVGATANVSIVVGKSTPVVTWLNPAGITYGSALSAGQLNATANVAGTFAYSPAAGTILNAGTQQLTVTFTPADSANFAGATANVSIAVAKAAPVVSWSNPTGVTYGTELSATQLNAGANVAGSFAYAPAAGIVLGAGTHNLSVTFTPADGANYTSAGASASIAIAPAALIVQANNASKVYGQALPAFTATGSGFVNGDSMASLAGTLVFATSATATSAPGTYAVTPGGVSSANYSITFANGTLTVTKAATSLVLTTTPNPSSNNQVVQLRTVVSAVAPGAGTATGTVEFRENGTLLGTATLVNGVATMNKSFKKGTHPLTATYAGNANFTGSTGGVTHQTP